MIDENGVVGAAESGLKMVGDQAPLFTALAKARADFAPVLKTKTNPFFGSKYADLADVLEACMPALTANGLYLCQLPTRPDRGGDWTVFTLLTHSSGAYWELRMTIPAAEWQKFGSALTYARRYVDSAVLGVASEPDDDGNEADAKRPPQPPQDRSRRDPPQMQAQAMKAAPAAPGAESRGQNGAPKDVGKPERAEPTSAPAPEAHKPGTTLDGVIERHVTDPERLREPTDLGHITTQNPDGPKEPRGPGGDLNTGHLPATRETKIAIRAHFMALGSRGPDVNRKIIEVFGPGTKVTDVATEAMSQKLLRILVEDVEKAGVAGRVTEIAAEQRKLVGQ
jgi:hypothetical protein